MIKKFDNIISISIDEYKKKKENSGKIAVFNFDNSTLIAEGEAQSDWLELELLCEELRKNGTYRIVIVPDVQPKIKLSYGMLS